MSDGRGAILDRVWDAIAGPATASTFMTVLIVAAFFLGAQVLSEHRQGAAALRVAGLLTGLTGLMLAIHRPGWVTELDTATTSWVVAHRSTGFDVAALVITDLGSPVATAAAAVICGALLSWRARSRVPGIVVIGTVSAAALASTALKAVVDRPRPPLQWLVLETDPSFPSGHVTGTAALLRLPAVCRRTRRAARHHRRLRRNGSQPHRTSLAGGWGGHRRAGHRRQPPLPRCALAHRCHRGGDPGRGVRDHRRRRIRGPARPVGPTRRAAGRRAAR